MKKLACALAATAALVGGSLVASTGAEARPYRYYAKLGYYGAYAYPRYGYYRRYRPNAGAAVAAGVAGGLFRGGPPQPGAPGLCPSPPPLSSPPPLRRFSRLHTNSFFCWVLF